MTRSSTRPDRLEELQMRLERAVTDITSGDDWARMLEAQARFHSYSWSNSLLILVQCPHASRVAGYRTWQSLGRQVQRGEKGIAILAPVVARKKDERVCQHDQATNDEPVQDREQTRVLAGFRVAHVWDVSATEGAELPEVAPVALVGEAPNALVEHLEAGVRSAGFSLVREDCSPANGCTDFVARTVTVRPDLSPAQVCKTLCHELAHATMHEEFVGHELKDGACRGRVEVEAESVAYVVCATAGLETGSYSFPYVARWARGDVALVASTAQRVNETARQITTAIGLEHRPDTQSELIPERDSRSTAHRARMATRRRTAASREGRSR
jgi:antirestriction protein ArdC